MMNVKTKLVLSFFDHMNCGENTLQDIIAQYAHQ